MSLFRTLHLRTPLLRFLRSHSHLPSDFDVQREKPKCLITERIPAALYGGRHTVTMLPGSGIGPEVCTYVRTIFKAMGAPVDFELIEIDPKSENHKDFGEALVSMKRNGVGIKGNIELQTFEPSAKLNILLRNELNLYVYILWCKSFPGVRAKHQNVDIVLIRQNTEGEYSMLEHSIGGSRVVESLKIVRRDSAQQIATVAFEFAKKYNRKKVTTIHKANIMKLSDGLFLEVSREVAKGYPDVAHDDIIVDNFCMQVVTNPKKFDVLLTTNLYGSIAANVICGISGGPGLMSGKNYGEHYAIFEPGTRNSGSAIAGRNLANPVAMLSASVGLLHHLGHRKQAMALGRAVYQTICVDRVHTQDLGGSAGSSDVINKVLEHL